LEQLDAGISLMRLIQVNATVRKMAKDQISDSCLDLPLSTHGGTLQAQELERGGEPLFNDVSVLGHSPTNT
jgi:hypothetical protein